MVKPSLLWVLEKPNQIATSLALRLQGEFAVRCFASIENMISIARLRHTMKPNAILINWSDYETSGLTECRTILAETLPKTLKIFVGPASMLEGHLGLSEAYLDNRDEDSLPIRVASLVQQLRSDLEQSEPGLSAFQLGSTFFDEHSLTLTEKLSGDVVQLPLKEAKILQLMLQTPSKCVSRATIMQKLWPRLSVSPRTLDSHVSRLRKRIEPVGLTIDSQYGAGYVLRLNQDF